jgi:hypothetical protein
MISNSNDVKYDSANDRYAESVLYLISIFLARRYCVKRVGVV